MQSFEEQILFEPTRFFEEVEFAKSMSSAQENEVGVSFGILLIFRLEVFTFNNHQLKNKSTLMHLYKAVAVFCSAR